MGKIVNEGENGDQGLSCGLGAVLSFSRWSWMLDTRSFERVDGVCAATAGLLYMRWEETGGGLGHEL